MKNKTLKNNLPCSTYWNFIAKLPFIKKKETKKICKIVQDNFTMPDFYPKN